MKQILKLIGLYLIALIGFSSCEKDDPKIPNEEELITTLIYTLEPVGGGEKVVLSFKDLDGDGGDDPVITTGALQSNTSYSCEIQLLNELETPAEDITKEVKEEGDEHQFFYSSNIGGLSVIYSDKDENNNPIGIATQLTTLDAGSGSLKIILRHEPDKFGEGVAAGDISNAGGETDIEVTFDIDVL